MEPEERYGAGKVQWKKSLPWTNYLSPATPVMLSEHGGEIMGKVCLTRNLIAQCDKRLIIMCYRRRELADGTDQR
jgi:hypothetical protein